jgi:vesicle-associated membrane protein-associated protein B
MGQTTLMRVTPTQTLNFSLDDFLKYSSKLTLYNLSPTPIAFKIKTTAPKNYLVRPSAGILLTRESKKIDLLLEKHGDDMDNSMDRFLIQAVPVDNDMKTLTKDFWSDIPREMIQHHRLNVSFIGLRNYTDDYNNASQSSIGEKKNGESNSQEKPDNGHHVSSDDADTLRSLKPQCNIAHRMSSDEKVKQNYNELLQYCLGVESKKKALASELEKANQKIEQLQTQLNQSKASEVPQHRSASPNAVKKNRTDLKNEDYLNYFKTSSSLVAWQLFALVLMVFSLLKFFCL